MKTVVRETAGDRVVVAVFDKGDEVIAGLEEVARTAGVEGAGFTAVGAFERATLGYFDRDRMDYLRIPVEEQVEVLSLVGDIAVKDREPKVHAHVVLGRRDGAALGGHVLEAVVWPTLEVVVTETPPALRRRHDEQTGLALIDLTLS
ncbi:MAG: DNA-binding protein [Actinobacteria bacterium]|nr:DNA-binding protein [Actinomycetota bacterium]